MSIFSSPWLHTRQVVMRYCASVKRRLKTRLALVISFCPPHPPSPLLSHSPAGFSQMEVAQHSRPALHNLRMKEGGSASHYTRFNPERGDDEAHKCDTETLCAYYYPKIHLWWLIRHKHVFIPTQTAYIYSRRMWITQLCAWLQFKILI